MYCLYIHGFSRESDTYVGTGFMNATSVNVSIVGRHSK